MYNTIDYQNALWGKDIFTLTGLDVRAEILNDIFPDIKEKTDELLKLLSDYKNITTNKETIYKMNQRDFNNWLSDIFVILRQSAVLAKIYLNHQKEDIPIIKLGDRELNRTALIGAYKNQTDDSMFTTIDNIIFIITDISLGFTPDESFYGILSKYISLNVPKFKTIPLKDISLLLQQTSPKYIMDDEYKDNKEIYFKIVDDITFLKE